jgi:hypothetical protein
MGFPKRRRKRSMMEPSKPVRAGDPASLIECQAEDAAAASSPLRPRILAQALYHLRHDGAFRTLKLIASKAAGIRPRPRSATARRSARNEVALHLRPGEFVEVKSESEIRETLDDSGRLRALRFLPQMRDFCGKRFRVHRRLERMVLEHSGEIRRVTNTVLLENVFCDGEASGCDRSCFLYWREAWLRRVPEEGPKGTAGAG